MSPCIQCNFSIYPIIFNDKNPDIFLQEIFKVLGLELEYRGRGLLFDKSDKSHLCDIFIEIIPSIKYNNQYTKSLNSHIIIFRIIMYGRHPCPKRGLINHCETIGGE